MTPRRSMWLGFGVLAVLAGLVWMFGGGHSEAPRQSVPKADLPLSEDADAVMQDVVLTHGGEGRMIWRLEARTARYGDDQGIIEVDEPRIVYYPGNAQPIRVTAAAGKARQKEGSVVLGPEVHAFYQDKLLKSPRLDYTEKDKLLHLSGPVKILGPDIEAEAGEVVMNPDSGRITAEKGIKAQFLLPAFR